MFKLILLALASLLATTAVADTKISQLPLGSAASTGVNDSFPYVDATAVETKRLKLSDLINVPTMVSHYAPLASPSFSGVVTGSFVGSLSGNASTCSAFDHTPTSCPGGQFATAQAANGNFTCSTPTGTGDVAGPASSADASMSLFDGLTGKLLKQSTLTGILKSTSGVPAAAVAGTDYQAAGNYLTALSSDVVASGPGSAAATIQTNVVSNTKLAQMTAHTYKGNNTGSTANAADVTSTQLTADLNVFTSSLQGLVPASGGASTSLFLTQAGTFAAAGTSSPLTTKGDLYTYSTTNDRLPVGSNDQLLIPNSGASTGLNWTTTLPTAAFPALTGDVTTSAGALATTLATVNSNVGSFTNGSFTVNGKGLITAASSGTAPVTSITVASANGFAGSSSGGATPALTLSTTITGILSGNGTAISAASTQGSGSVVLATSPTITTPTIAKLANLTTNGIVYTTGADGTLNSGPLTGDVTSSGAATTLATVNSNVGSFTAANITVNAKGLITAASNGSGSAPANIVQSISQTSHGFSVGDVLYCTSTTSCSKAKADSATTSDVNGIVLTVTNSNAFVLLMDGYITGLSGKVANTVYFLDPATAGALTATQPTTAGYIDMPLFKADSTTSGYFHIQRGVVITSTGTNTTPWAPETRVTFSAAFGTTSAVNLSSRCVAGEFELQGNFLAGTVTAVNSEIILPAGMVISSVLGSSANGHALGMLWNNDPSGGGLGIFSTNRGYVVFFDGSTTDRLFLANASASKAFVKVTDPYNNNSFMDFKIAIPVSAGCP